MLLGWPAVGARRGGGVLLAASFTYPLHPTPQKTRILRACTDDRQTDMLDPGANTRTSIGR